MICKEIRTHRSSEKLTISHKLRPHASHVIHFESEHPKNQKVKAHMIVN